MTRMFPILSIGFDGWAPNTQFTGVANTASNTLPNLLSITNYRMVNVQSAALGMVYKTYQADLLNMGLPVGSVHASVATLDPFALRIVPGLDTLSFAPVPYDTEVASTSAFTVVTDPTVPVDFSKLQWTFQETAASPVAIINFAPTDTFARVGPGVEVQLDGRGSADPSGVGTLTYRWTITSRPQGSSPVLFSNSATSTFVSDFPGTYVITLTVSNGAASSATSATVTVLPRDFPPSAEFGFPYGTVPGATYYVGEELSLDGTRSVNPSGVGTLMYNWMFASRPPGSSSTLSSSNSALPTFVPDIPGTYVITLTVSNGVASGSESLPIIVVAPPNQ